MNHIDRDTENAVRRFLALIADQYDAAEAIVYGSRARGTHRQDSDADVAVLLRGNPLGYPGSYENTRPENPGFDPNRVVEV